MPKSQTLTFPPKLSPSEDGEQVPLSPQSPGSPQPLTPGHEENPDWYTSNTALPPYPEPMKSPKSRKASIFSNNKASKSSTKLQFSEPSIRHVADDSSQSTTAAPVSQANPDHQGMRSRSEINLIGESASIVSDDSVEPHNSIYSIKSNNASQLSESSKPKRAATKKGLFTVRRTGSLRSEESSRSRTKLSTAESGADQDVKQGSPAGGPRNLRSASSREDRSLRGVLTSSARTRSADKSLAVESEEEALPTSKNKPAASSFSSSFKDSQGAFLHNFKSSSSKAADGLGKAGKGFFGKFARAGSTNEKEVPNDEINYHCRVINLPLIKQTRVTRISKRLEESRDKTEFWMPALPWRCIE